MKRLSALLFVFSIGLLAQTPRPSPVNAGGGGGGGGGSPAAPTNSLQKNNGSGGFGASSVTDNGIVSTPEAFQAASVATGSAPPSVTVGTGGVPFACGEGTAPSAGVTAGVDLAYCDSTLHSVLLSLNGGPYQPLTCGATVTTGTTATLSTCFTVNQEATAATGVTYTLPTAAQGLQYCVDNGWNGSAANTGVLTFATSASGQFMVYTDGTLTATGGNVTSGGAARDGACVYGIDSTHWMFLPHSGTWTKH